MLHAPRLAIALSIALMLSSPLLAEEAAAPPPRPKVEVVFVLDTTGSMGGLIEGAKVKIWRVVNQIVSGDPVPDVRVGLVAYRDRGDAYVTKLTPLTHDLDVIYGVLRGLSAGGGGDGPESVNEALHVAVTEPAWSRSGRVLRIIYLVGDAPPHMDYGNDVKYPVSCEAAARAGIIVNTIQCGNVGGTTEVWKRIAGLAEGRYFRIDQSGGMVRVETPFDARMAELARELSASTRFYGDREARDRLVRELEEKEADAAAAPPEARAERAGYLGKSRRAPGADLLALLESGELKLGDVKEEHLSEDLRKLTPEKRQARIRELLESRKKLRAELVELDAKRTAFLKEAAAKRGAKGDAFDEKVLEALREQAKKIEVDYD
jgi:hypothetical protein